VGETECHEVDFFFSCLKFFDDFVGAFVFGTEVNGYLGAVEEEG